MLDLADHPFSSESIAFESGAPSKAERAWLRFVDGVERMLGHSVDGNDAKDAGCGYSLDECYAAWEAGDTAAEYVAEVRTRTRYDGGADVGVA